jgi:UDPglucose 6-dehydrogenase
LPGCQQGSTRSRSFTEDNDDSFTIFLGLICLGGLECLAKRGSGKVNLKGGKLMKARSCLITLVFGLWIGSSCIAADEKDKAKARQIAVIGTGYVGLAAEAGLAELGHTVVGVDIDARKIAALQEGVIPIYEPGLKEIVERNMRERRLSFSTDVEGAIRNSDVIFIAVGTPMAEDGSADLSDLTKVAQTIRDTLSMSDNRNKYTVICIKSTVPIGTGAQVHAIIDGKPENTGKFGIASNPEFLREGNAVKDFLEPDRIVVGSNSPQALSIMHEIYKPLINSGVPYLETSGVTAETIKYASNAFLATKLSFINEIANLADITGADVELIARGMGLDKRIGHQFLHPGPGFGGYCFPKDCNALMYMAKKYGVDLKLVKAALEVNQRQRAIIVDKLVKLINKDDLEGQTIAILGLAFKANTDDVRLSPALDVAQLLLQRKATVKAYDPVASKNAAAQLPGITYLNSAYDAVRDADAIIIMTEWDEFKLLDLHRIADLVKSKIIIDARNILNPQEVLSIGFKFDNIGRAGFTAS